MAYGLKYELLCTSRKSNLYKAKIYFDGYSGSAINRNVPKNPFKLIKDKAAVIRGTSFEFSIREEVDFEFLEFYTNSNKKIRVDLYRGTTLIWTGYNLTQQYQAPYTPSPTNISFTASDGLGLLKNEEFTLTGINSQLATIIHCVDKIGLALGYSIAINLFEVTHSHTASPLAQTYEDASNFIGLNCYEVIESILQKYDAEITQRRGRWGITCSVDKQSTRMLYTTAGVYETTEAAPTVLDLGYPGTGIEVSPKGRLQQSFEPGAKKVKLTHDFGRKDSFLTNYDFSEFATPSFPGWTKTGTFDLTQGVQDGKSYAILDGYSSNDDCITQSINITNVASQNFVFSLKFAPLGKYENVWVSGSNIFPVTMDVRLHVYITNGTYTWYLTKTGWLKYSTDLQKITLSVNSCIGNPVFNELKIITNEIPISGTLYIKLYRYNHGTPDSGIIYRGIAFTDVNVCFMNGNDLYPASLATTAVFDTSTEVGELTGLDIFTTDAPDFINNNLLYKRITWLLSGAITTLWHRLGSTTTYTLLVQLARMIASNNRIARQRLSGEFKGTGIELDSIILHAYNSNRKFEILEGTWDLYEETFNVTLLELLTWSDESITFTSESSLTSTSNTSASGSIIGISLGNTAGSGLFDRVFEVIDYGLTSEYLRLKVPLAADFDVQAWSDNGQLPATIWDSLPVASATALGGIKVGANLSIVNGVLSADAAPGGGAWGDITGTLADQTDLNTALGLKLNSSSYTAADVLSKLLTVDGSSSGLDADKLDGAEGALYARLSGPTFTGTVSGISASMVGLGSVNNTSDADKPVSTAQQTALNLKSNIASPTFTGTVRCTGDIIAYS